MSKAEDKMREAFQAWWDDQCSKGDPNCLPNKFSKSFAAGWDAATAEAGNLRRDAERWRALQDVITGLRGGGA